MRGKKTVVGKRCYNPHIEAVGGVGPDQAIADKGSAAGKIAEELVVERGKTLRRKRSIDLAPVNFVMHFWLVHDKAVFGRAPGVFAGVDRERTRRG